MERQPQGNSEPDRPYQGQSEAKVQRTHQYYIPKNAWYAFLLQYRAMQLGMEQFRSREARIASELRSSWVVLNEEPQPGGGYMQIPEHDSDEDYQVIRPEDIPGITSERDYHLTIKFGLTIPSEERAEMLEDVRLLAVDGLIRYRAAPQKPPHRIPPHQGL